MPGSETCFVPDDLELRDLPVLIFIATMSQDLHAKIQVRNLYLPASRLGSLVSLQFWIVVHSR